MGTNQPARKIPEEDFWEICPKVFCVFSPSHPTKKCEIVLDRKELSDLSKDVLSNMCLALFGIIFGVMSQKMLLPIHLGDTNKL